MSAIDLRVCDPTTPLSKLVVEQIWIGCYWFLYVSFNVAYF